MKVLYCYSGVLTLIVILISIKEWSGLETQQNWLHTLTANRHEGPRTENTPQNHRGIVSSRGSADCPNNRRGITLVTVATINRLPSLWRICQVWPGPVVAVVSTGDFDPMKIPGFVGRPEHTNATMFCARAKIVSGEYDGLDFPINRLRNLGIKLVTTSHMLYLDVDLLPSADLYSTLISQLSQPRLQGPNIAIVVPAFEFTAHKGCELNSTEACQKLISSWLPEVPQNFKALRNCVDNGLCQLFHFARYSQGHSTTNYDEWVAQGDKQTRRISCFKSNEYEPYVMIQTCSLIPKLFDDAFKGYGKNKIQMIEHLRYAGYSFYVLPKEFTIHVPHKVSRGRQSFTGKRRKYVENKWKSWKRKLHEKYGTKTLQTPICGYGGTSKRKGK